MKDDNNMTIQPDLYRCDLCEDYSPTNYGIVIHLDYYDEQLEVVDGEREWPYRLCRHCYYNWMEGRLSTKELIMLCNHNIERRAKV